MATIQEIPLAREFDIFSKPHERMRRLIATSARQVKETNFTDTGSLKTLLDQLQSILLQFHIHEEIEDKYIMNVLKHRLTGVELAKLIDHLSADSHIEEMIDMMKTFEKRLQKGIESTVTLLSDGQELFNALITFYDDYLPHMVEEEQVYLPLILQYFSYDELKDMRQRVLTLQQVDVELSEKVERVEEGLESSASEEEETISPLLTLPSELIVNIFSYLPVPDLCHIAQTCKSLELLAFDGKLWQEVYPTEWSTGNWASKECACTSEECNCDCEPNFNMVQFRDLCLDSDSESSDHEEDGEGDFKDQRIKRETDILLGLTRFVLPKVGAFMKKIVLGCSKAISNGLLYRMLSQCPHLEYLDVSQTIISDLGLNGLFKNGGGRHLKHLNLSGCTGVTDKTLIKLGQTQSRSKYGMRKDSQCVNCTCKTRTIVPSVFPGQRLRFLALSGCYKISDSGLRALIKNGALVGLEHLDLSGCLHVSGIGISDLVKNCEALDHSQLFYCDNIVGGPYSETASGCQNVDCRHRVCCRTGI